MSASDNKLRNWAALPLRATILESSNEHSLRLALYRFVALAVGVALSGCITKADVSVDAAPSIVEAAPPLNEGEAIVLLGRNSHDDDLRDCVRDEVVRAPPTTRIIKPAEFRAAAGGKFALSKSALTNEAVGQELIENQVQQAIADLTLGYVIVVDGKSSEETKSSTKYNGVENWTGLGTTSIVAEVWAAATGRYVGTLGVTASGTDEFVGAFPVPFFLKVALTKPRACQEMGKHIAAYLSKGFAAGVSHSALPGDQPIEPGISTPVIQAHPSKG